MSLPPTSLRRPRRTSSCVSASCASDGTSCLAAFKDPSSFVVRARHPPLSCEPGLMRPRRNALREPTVTLQTLRGRGRRHGSLACNRGRLRDHGGEALRRKRWARFARQHARYGSRTRRAHPHLRVNQWCSLQSGGDLGRCDAGRTAMARRSDVPHRSGRRRIRRGRCRERHVREAGVLRVDPRALRYRPAGERIRRDVRPIGRDWGCSRRREGAVPFAVGAYITAAYWFTSSTSFANPAVTLARAASNTFAGIRPADVLGFVVAQLLGAAAATATFRWRLTLPTAAERVLDTREESP